MLCFNKGGDGIGNTAHIALVDDVENADLVNVGLLIVRQQDDMVVALFGQIAVVRAEPGLRNIVRIRTVIPSAQHLQQFVGYLIGRQRGGVGILPTAGQHQSKRQRERKQARKNLFHRKPSLSGVGVGADIGQDETVRLGGQMDAVLADAK